MSVNTIYGMVVQFGWAANIFPHTGVGYGKVPHVQVGPYKLLPSRNILTHPPIPDISVDNSLMSYSVEQVTTVSLSRLLSKPPSSKALVLVFGSSRPCTAAQAAHARTIMEDKIGKLPHRQPVIFTDGSVLSNPGPCGAAAVCYAEGMESQPLVLKEAVSKLSTSYHGELRAMLLATQFGKEYSSTHHITVLNIFTDCQAVIASVTSSRHHRTHQETIDQCIANISALVDKRIVTLIHWVPGTRTCWSSSK